jgi:hypothetical protein
MPGEDHGVTGIFDVGFPPVFGALERADAEIVSRLA